MTAMASDPGSRFQTAQQLIEALDAFAVREKLTGSTSVARPLHDPAVRDEEGAGRRREDDQH